MKTINEILDSYDDYETFLVDSFGIRLCNFLTEKQAGKIGFILSDSEKAEGHLWPEPIAWTEDNVKEQLRKDIVFGYEKCENERGISSELMYSVCKSWCKVLENGLENTEYGWYGRTFFETVAAHYGFDLHKIEDDTEPKP